MNEVRLIDANVAAQGLMLRKWESRADAFMAYEVLQTAPTIDAEIVRHGRWVIRKERHSTDQTNRCSVCGASGDPSWIRCQRCEARMDEVTE